MKSALDAPSAETKAVLDRSVRVEFLYLDDTVCEPCSGTARALSECVDLLAASLTRLGIRLEVEKIRIDDEQAAISEKLLLSPTIRINGEDIDPARTEAACPSCGTLAGDASPISCRTWHWRGGVYHAAPVGMLVEAIMRAALSAEHEDGSCCGNECCGDDAAGAGYEVPENLTRFFAARTGREGQGSSTAPL